MNSGSLNTYIYNIFRGITDMVDEAKYEIPDLVKSYLDKFNAAARSNAALQMHTAESLAWFQKRVSKDMRHSRYSLIRDYGDFKRRTGKENKTLVGRLYYFQYEAEEAGDKDNMVYDAFPMVYIFGTSISSDGKKLIHALNTHYLLPKERAFLYLKLLKIRNKKNWTDSTKLKISWEIIKQLVAHRIYAKSVHTYRVDRIQSKLIEIKPEYWEIATFLRLEKWIHVDGNAIHQKDIRAAHRKSA
jgi:hypothetical protein